MLKCLLPGGIPAVPDFPGWTLNVFPHTPPLTPHNSTANHLLFFYLKMCNWSNPSPQNTNTLCRLLINSMLRSFFFFFHSSFQLQNAIRWLIRRKKKFKLWYVLYVESGLCEKTKVCDTSLTSVCTQWLHSVQLHNKNMKGAGRWFQFHVVSKTNGSGKCEPLGHRSKQGSSQTEAKNIKPCTAELEGEKFQGVPSSSTQLHRSHWALQECLVWLLM